MVTEGNENEGYNQADIFKTRYEPEIQYLFALKKRLFVLILGAYFPTSVQDRLVRLKLYLQKEGYSNTYLVKDLKDPPQEPGEEEDKYIARKSLFWMERADVLLFIFFCKGRNEGVASELSLATNILRPVKRAAFYEEKCKKGFSRMITGIPKLFLIDQYYFSSDNALYRKATAACFGAIHAKWGPSLSLGKFL